MSPVENVHRHRKPKFDLILGCPYTFETPMKVGPARNAMSLPLHWAGALSGRRNSQADLVLVAPLQPSTAGGSGAFQVKASDGNRYWVKVLNNGQGSRVPITEQIVGRAGVLLGAPCCAVKTIEIPSGLPSWEFRPGLHLEPGIGHASFAIDPVIEVRSMANRSHDENEKRHAYVHALYDWCWGGDHQWLVAISDENRYHSHDHGWYLPPTGH